MIGCANGCTVARRHLTGCADPGECPGCQPRPALAGVVCIGCRAELGRLLADAPLIYAWLAEHVGRGGSRPPDAMPHAGQVDPPAVIRAEVVDLMNDYRDTLGRYAQDMAHRLRAHPVVIVRRDVNTDTALVAASARWLRNNCPRMSELDAAGGEGGEFPPAVALLAALLDLARTAHRVAPWRPILRRCVGVPCPECHMAALVVHGGEMDVSCQECGLTMTPEVYAVWTVAAAAVLS